MFAYLPIFHIFKKMKFSIKSSESRIAVVFVCPAEFHFDV